MPMIVNAPTSPLVDVFSDFSRALVTAPTPEERDLRRAMAESYRANAAEDTQRQQAVSGLKGSLADIFSAYTADGKPADQFVGPAPAEGLVMEDPAAQMQRRSTGLADLYARLGDAADEVQMGLATAQAYGTPDDMRRSMVLLGKNIGPDFAPTGAEGDRIRTAAMTEELRKVAATPLTKAQVQGQYLNENFDNLAALTPEQRTALGAEPKAGLSVTTNPDGSTEINMGGPLGTKATNDLQSKAATLDEYSRTLDYFEQLMKDAPPQAFGTMGNLQRGAQALSGQAQNFGLIKPVDGENPQATIDRTFSELRSTAAQMPGVSPELLAGVFDPQLDALGRMNSVLVWGTASAIAGQEGRGVTDRDIKIAQRFTPDPSAWFASKDSEQNKFQVLRDLVGIKKGTIDRMTGVDSVNANTVPAPPGSAPAGGPDPAVQNVIAKAREKIARNGGNEQVRAAVIKKLQAAGITPPGDL